MQPSPERLPARARRWGAGPGAQWRGGRGPAHSINFITAHDGFTLADLVAYNEKHNAANGEKNRSEPPLRQAAGMPSSCILCLCPSAVIMGPRSGTAC